MRRPYLLLCLVVFLVGCVEVESPTPRDEGLSNDGLGTLRIQLHDGPIDDVDAVWLTFDGVEAHHASAGWIQVSTQTTQLDLLSLQGGAVVELGLAELPVGDYDEIRLNLTASSVDVGGTSHPLTVPSGDTSGLKIKTDFTLEDCGEVLLDLDWDVGAHLIHNKKGYKLRPTVLVDTRVDTEGCQACSGEIRFADPLLEQRVRDTLNLAEGTPILAEDAENLVVLDGSKLGISSLEGLECAPNLRELNLFDNPISDLSPLAGLTELQRLWAHGSDTNIGDISSLAGLTKLWDLRLSQFATATQKISDLSALNQLTSLKVLELSGHNISDLNPLSGLSQLQTLLLHQNPISDLSPLAGLTELQRLWAHGSDTNIGDISSLAGLTKLWDLRLSQFATATQKISDLSALTSMSDLRIFEANGHAISDTSPLAGRCAMRSVRLLNNPISCPDATLDALEACGVSVVYSCLP